MAGSSNDVVAFFDMDRTVVLCNTGRVYFEDMRSKGELTKVEILQLTSVLLRYKLSMIDMSRVMRRAASRLVGLPEQDMISRCQGLFDSQVANQVSQAAVESIESHRRLGHHVVLLSASTNYMVEPLARHLKISEYICTRLGTDDGKFTGTVVEPICFGEGKIHWASAYAKQHGIDLQDAYFYTDSYSDKPMLDAVGYKRVVNPDPRLRMYAALKRWPVLRFER